MLPSLRAEVGHGLPSDTSHKIDISRKTDVSISTRTVSVLAAEISRQGLHRNVRWWHAVALLMADVFGTGVLSLPQATAEIGWVLGLTFLFLFAMASIYSGSLLARTLTLFPDQESYGEMGKATIGPRAGVAASTFMMLNLLTVLPIYLVATLNSIRLIFPQATLCTWQLSLIIVALLVLPIQLQELKQVSFLAFPSASAMVLVLILVIESLATSSEHPFGASTSVSPQSGIAFFSFFNALSGIIFAYAGHSRFLEVANEMENPSKEFSKAIVIAYSVMTFAYAATVILAYGIVGETVQGFLPASMSDGAVRRAAGVFLSFHVLVSYTFVSNVTVKKLRALVFDRQGFKEATPPTRMLWGLISTGYLGISYLLTNSIPFFAALQSLVGALTGAPLVFFFPCAFYVSAMKRSERKLALVDAVACTVLALICAPVLFSVGTVSAVLGLIDAIKTSQTPFTC